MSGDAWRFALEFYQRAGVADACLRLQDDAGADVCLLLHLLHRAAAGQIIAAEQVAQLDAAARPWREAVIVPLRAARRYLRRAPDGYYDIGSFSQSLQAQEIAAERMQLEFLHAHGAEPDRDPVERMAAARANLLGYGALLMVSPETMDPLLGLFAAAEPNAA